MTQQVAVTVQSAWYSKINWAAALTGLAGVIGGFTPILPPAWAAKATGAAALIGSVAVWVARTFYTTTVTPSSITTTTPSVR